MLNLVIIGRHGTKDKHPELKEGLSDESIGDLYSQGVDIAKLFNINITPEKVATYNSQRVRTEATNKARLAGILGLTPVPVHQGDVLNNDRSNNNYQFHPELALVDVNGRHGLGYYPGEMNESVFIANEKLRSGTGGRVCTEFGLQNLSATEHEGMKILPFGYIVAKSAGVIQEAIERVIRGSANRKDLAMVTSHAVIVDAGIASLVTSGKSNNIRDLPKSVAKYGGSFAEGNYGILYVSKSEKDGVLFRDSKEYPVNIGRFFELVSALQQKYPASLITKKD